METPCQMWRYFRLFQKKKKVEIRWVGKKRKKKVEVGLSRSQQGVGGGGGEKK